MANTDFDKRKHSLFFQVDTIVTRKMSYGKKKIEIQIFLCIKDHDYFSPKLFPV